MIFFFIPAAPLSQSLTGVGIAAAETVAGGSVLARSPRSAQSLVGVGIPSQEVVFPGLLAQTFPPGTGPPPVSGGSGNIRLGDTINSVTVPSPKGVISYAYMARSDMNMISLLDTRTPAYVAPIIYQTHPFTGEEQQRNLRKRVMSIFVFGSGVLDPTHGFNSMVVSVDGGLRSDAYSYTPACQDAAEGILWAQYTIPIVGKVIDVTLTLAGTGIVITEVQIQYVILG